MQNFWKSLVEPFTVLAPMDDVTDNVFRQVVLSAGRPDVFFTEFTNADGLVHGGHGIPLRKLNFTKDQHPIVAQIWGNKPGNMEKAAKIVKDLGFDGIDINMGCPIREVVRSKAGAGLIGEWELAEKIVRAVQKGAEGMPVSVKTRLGINKNIADEWTTFLLKLDIAALTIHSRTATQMSKGSADWEQIKKITEIRDKVSPGTLVIGNGDIKSYKEAVAMHEKYDVDGIMIGRGIFDNPWVFVKEERIYTTTEYIDLMEMHINLFEKTWGDSKNFAILKKFFKVYIKDFRGANDLRQEFMETKDMDEIKTLMKKFRATATDRSHGEMAIG